MKKIYTDQEIINGLKDENDKQKLRLFQELFFEKYKGYLYKVAIQRCVTFRDAQESAKDITQITFINAFEKIKTFDLSKEDNPSKHEFIVKAWLGRIANNCFNKVYAQKKDKLYLDEIPIDNFDLSYDMFESIYEGDPLEVPNEFRLKLQDALKTLTDPHRHILLTYAEEGCIHNNKHLSDSTMNYLCQLYDTSSANIRQIKKRSLDKVKKHCFSANN